MYGVPYSPEAAAQAYMTSTNPNYFLETAIRHNHEVVRRAELACHAATVRLAHKPRFDMQQAFYAEAQSYAQAYAQSPMQQQGYKYQEKVRIPTSPRRTFTSAGEKSMVSLNNEDNPMNEGLRRDSWTVKGSQTSSPILRLISGLGGAEAAASSPTRTPSPTRTTAQAPSSPASSSPQQLHSGESFLLNLHRDLAIQAKHPFNAYQDQASEYYCPARRALAHSHYGRTWDYQRDARMREKAAWMMNAGWYEQPAGRVQGYNGYATVPGY